MNPFKLATHFYRSPLSLTFFLINHKKPTPIKYYKVKGKTNFFLLYD